MFCGILYEDSPLTPTLVREASPYSGCQPPVTLRDLNEGC